MTRPDMNRLAEGPLIDGAIASSGPRSARRFGVALAGLAMLTVLSGCAQTEVVEVMVEVPVEVPRCNLPDLSGGRTFTVEAWAVPDPRFDVGEPLSLQMRVSTPAYLNIFYVSTSCKVTRLLHNRAMPVAQIVDFPLAESGLEMTVKPPAGDEAFYFVATREPMSFLSGSDILAETAGIASLDLSPAQFYRNLDDARGRTNPDDWSSMTLRTTVVGR